MKDETTTAGAVGTPQDTGATSGSDSTTSNSSASDKASNVAGATDSEKATADDEFDGLTAKELRRLLSESQNGKKVLDSELAQIKGKLEERERKERTELENYKADVDKLTAENAELKQALETTAITNAILNNRKFQFHDATDVLNNLKITELKVDTKTGQVEGIDLELARVAKEKPFLVLNSAKDDKVEKVQNNGSTKQNQNSSPSGPTGFQPGQGGGSGNGVQETRASLLSKYPILQNH